LQNLLDPDLVNRVVAPDATSYTQTRPLMAGQVVESMADDFNPDVPVCRYPHQQSCRLPLPSR
jgi:hypothetical protein